MMVYYVVLQAATAALRVAAAATNRPLPKVMVVGMLCCVAVTTDRRVFVWNQRGPAVAPCTAGNLHHCMLCWAPVCMSGSVMQPALLDC